LGEKGERVVARAHDDDAVARLGEGGKGGGAGFAGGDMLGGGAVDLRDDLRGADRAVHRAAEIDWVAEQDVVGGGEEAGEGLRQFCAHLPQGTVAVGLKEGEDAARMGFECFERGGDLIGIVAEIVDDGDARRAGAGDVEAAG